MHLARQTFQRCRYPYVTPALTAPSTTASVNLDSTEIVVTPALSNPNGAAGLAYSGHIKIIVGASGASGSVRAGGLLIFNSSATMGVPVNVPVKTTTIDTTVSHVLQLGALASANAANDSNSLTFLTVSESRPVKASN